MFNSGVLETCHLQRRQPEMSTVKTHRGLDMLRMLVLSPIPKRDSLQNPAVCELVQRNGCRNAVTWTPVIDVIEIAENIRENNAQNYIGAFRRVKQMVHDN